MADFSAPTSHTDGVDGDSTTIDHNDQSGRVVLQGQHGADSQINDGDLFSRQTEPIDLFGSQQDNDHDSSISVVNNTIKTTTISGVNETVVGIVKSSMTPPPRPPPPATGSNGTPRAVSPVAGGVSSGSGNASTTTTTNKSAFDDLNDSIRMALGGSPSRPSPSVQQQQLQQLQQQPQMIIQQQGYVVGGVPVGVGQNTIGTVPGYVVPPNQVILGYGSPIKQPIAGDGNY